MAKPPARAHAIVLDLDHNYIGLQTVRILADRGVPVIAVARDSSHWACRTNMCERIVTTKPTTLEALKQLGSELPRKGVLYPCTDERVAFVARNRQHLEPWYHIVLPPADTVEQLMDKARFYPFAEQNGFPIPPTVVIHNPEDAERAAETLSFPSVVKPPKKIQEWRERTRRKGIVVRSATELMAVYQRLADLPVPLIAQSWIGGSVADLFSCNCYFDRNGQLLVSFVARKIRQWPPRTGQSSLGVEERNDTVHDITIRLFQSVGFQGLGYLEVKFDPASNQYFIVEPNIGRPTGRSAIAENGGVELLYTMYADAVGLPLPEKRQQLYRGAKWIDIRRDIPSAFYNFRRGKLSIRGWWKSWKGLKHDAVFRWRDPRPFVSAVTQGFGLLRQRKRHLGDDSPTTESRKPTPAEAAAER